MKSNVGKIDRALRVILGVVLIALPFVVATETGPFAALGGFGWVAMIAGAIMILTGGMRFCPLYRILGIGTCPIDTKSAR
ncbi:DUF2892 domain-containing protein [Thalassospira lucentensis]|uniref:YgaP family membrane protein n=1 Tax=Thalassospira lucentensis TaxID=168935 RepID=UPI002941C9F3|nr:DUF2892 domain-containing protein [Thalassospira lucentensis]WOI10750.1 DUF2892 domain-containing protein [Thalassospira lucentensis]